MNEDNKRLKGARLINHESISDDMAKVDCPDVQLHFSALNS